ncbi:MAG: ABC transporter permease subunit, partial [Bdellovibrionaceae bacterium]|nr:ABC transporter permease subunit [Pseudobdellovibrionaceae bacterium]
MIKFSTNKPASFTADMVFLLLACTLIYGLTHFGQQWESSYNPNYEIDLSFVALPLYALFSALRGLIAYIISLLFTIVVGYWAAKSLKAERIIIPFLDIMQSIPVLGFLPGLVLGLVALFPKTNVGLEMSAIIMIFTGQVWNMTFAFYSSLKSVPTDLKEASAVMGLSSIEKLKLLELPYSAMSLTWNSVMSMAGGWFFLTVCEAFTLGGKDYRLPGLGAYMAVAIEKGEIQPIIGGIVAMAVIIILFDAIFWRPALAWAHKFRLEEDNQNQRIEEPLIQLLIKESFVMKIFKSIKFQSIYNKQTDTQPFVFVGKFLDFKIPQLSDRSYRIVIKVFYIIVHLAVIYGTTQLTNKLSVLNLQAWLEILRDTSFTLLRVAAATAISTLWALPFGI